ncbi:MAG TPA: hypothetical protein VFT65_13280 [Candidatus Angelobacter sp.]|nr:hypothetical protein [Candidatus Angelobacter sp.]
MAQLEACKKKIMFALHNKPKNPELHHGELLLLQLIKGEAEKLDKTNGRIEFILVFDHLQPDPDGKISRKNWPSEDRVWKWILYCSEIFSTTPFSLENLNLSKNYAGQTNPRYIDPKDEKLILEHISRRS